MAFNSVLQDFISSHPEPESLWSGQYKIPWNDPDFSRRMLKEHLSQEHDLASRRSTAIQAQVEWIHTNLCENEPTELLDLGCGPGLYLKEFVSLGYDCRGIDFSPASIEYARAHIGDKAELLHGDIREQAFGEGYSVVMMIYGELDVFSPQESRHIVGKAFDALASGGKLLLEVHRYDAVKQIGNSPNSWYKSQSGLFSDKPHICLIENHWFEAQATALQQFLVIEAQSGETNVFRSTTKARTDNELVSILEDTGFTEVVFQENWPADSDNLRCFTAIKPVI